MKESLATIRLDFPVVPPLARTVDSAPKRNGGKFSYLSLFTPTGINHLMQRLLRTPPQLDEIEKHTPEIGSFDSKDVFKKNSTFFHRNLSGASRLLSICSTQILNNGVAKSRDDLQTIDQQSTFIAKCLDFLNAEPDAIPAGFVSLSTISNFLDVNACTSIIQFIICVLSISRAEHDPNFHPKGKFFPVVKRFVSIMHFYELTFVKYLEDALDLLSDKSVAGDNICNNAQLLIASHIITTLDKRKLICPDEISRYHTISVLTYFQRLDRILA